MANIEIRQATVADLETLLQFEQGIISFERPFDSALKTEHINYYDIEAMINDEKCQVLVATDGTKLVASGYAKIVQSKPYVVSDQHAYLGFMFVLPDYRGQGINKLINDALFSWARSKNIDEIRLEVYAENSAAIRAYEKAGFTKNLLEMRLSLSEQ